MFLLSHKKLFLSLKQRRTRKEKKRGNNNNNNNKDDNNNCHSHVTLKLTPIQPPPLHTHTRTHTHTQRNGHFCDCVRESIFTSPLFSKAGMTKRQGTYNTFFLPFDICNTLEIAWSSEGERRNASRRPGTPDSRGCIGKLRDRLDQGTQVPVNSQYLARLRNLVVGRVEC